MGAFQDAFGLVKRFNNTFNYLKSGLELYKLGRYNEDVSSSEGEPIYVLAKSKDHAFSIAVNYLRLKGLRHLWF